MKKIIALVLVLTLSLFAFAACGGKDKGDNNDNNTDNNTPAEKTYTLATATISKELSGRSSKIANNFVVIVFDADGKIVAARFDSIESAHPTVENGEIVLDASNLLSKTESNYKKGQMADTWGNQIKAFENYIVGKTAAEVAALELTTTGEDGKAVNAGLVAGCTMVSTSYSSMLDCQALVAKAAASTKKVEFKVAEGSTITLGLGVDASVAFNRSKNIEFTATCAGTVLVGDKVVAAIIDSTIQTYTVADGVVTKPATYTESKLVQGDAYGMLSQYGSTLAEWYVQAQNYANTAVGKTAADVANLSTDKIEGSCTMYVGGYKAVLAEAAANAR